MDHIKKVYQSCCQMPVHQRHPYAGELVFTAFSGSHQDAINKGLGYMAEHNSPYWEVPYLPIDPKDLGRQYEPIIRINSQSGKGGAAFVMRHVFGYQLPKAMHPEFGALVKAACERARRELAPEEVLAIFQKEYLEVSHPYHLLAYRIFEENAGQGQVVDFEGVIRYHHVNREVSGRGNGPIDAFFNALRVMGLSEYEVCHLQRARRLRRRGLQGRVLHPAAPPGEHGVRRGHGPQHRHRLPQGHPLRRKPLPGIGAPPGGLIPPKNEKSPRRGSFFFSRSPCQHPRQGKHPHQRRLVEQVEQ